MANCIAYGLIAELLVSGNVSDSFKQTAMDYGISANLTTAAQVKSIMLQCSNQCRALQTGGASYDFPTNSTITYEELPEALSDMCLDVVASALPDIAGIGIYIAYWLQSGIALAAFSLLKLYDFWIYYIVLSTLVWRRGYVRARNAAHLVRRKAKERALPRLVTALVEFQKAQCYFMLAVQIAAIVTISKGKSEANNLQQLYNNWEVVHVISISGFLPTSFNLLCLQSVGKRSWYLTILSTITVGISIVTLFRTGSFSPSLKDMDDLAKKSSTMEFCGNQDPTLYCLERYMDDATIGSSSTNIMLIFSLIILVYLIVDLLPIPKSMFYIYCSARLERSKTFRITAAMVARVLSKARQFLDLSYIWLAARRERNGFAASVLRISEYWRSMLVIFLYTSAWGLYLFFISELMSYFQLFLTYGMVNRTWNFGQIVGITVWAEPLVEFAYLELKGMSAANYRFLTPWIMVKEQENPNSSGKEMEQPLRNPIPLTKKKSAAELSVPSIEIRSGYSFDQEEGQAHEDEEQHTDTMAQRLL